MNCGAYSHVNPRFERILKKLKFKHQKLSCIARRSIATVAVGYGKRHNEENIQLLHTLDKYIA